MVTRSWIAPVLALLVACAPAARERAAPAAGPGATAAVASATPLHAAGLRPVVSRGFGSDGRAILWSGDGRVLLSVRYGSITVLDGDSLAVLRERALAAEEYSHVTVQPGGRLAAVTSKPHWGSGNVQLEVFDVSTLEPVLALKWAASSSAASAVRQSAFSPDGKVFAVLEPDFAVTLYETERFTVRARLAPEPGVKERLFVFSPDARTLLVQGTRDNERAELWSVEGKLLGSPNVRFDVGQARYGSTGAYLYWHGFDEHQKTFTPVLYDVRRQTARTLQGSCGTIAAFSPDDALVATTDGATLCLWEAATGKLSKRHGLGFEPRRVAFARDGRALLASDSGWGAAALYRVPGLAEVQRWNDAMRVGARRSGLPGDDDTSAEIPMVLLSQAGELSVVGDGATVRRFAAPEGLKDHPPAGYGRWLLDARDGAITLIDLQDGKRRSLPGFRDRTAFRFRPGGSDIAAGTNEGELRVLALATGTQRAELPFPPSQVRALAFERGELVVASAPDFSGRASVQRWNLGDGRRAVARHDRPGLVDGLLLGAGRALALRREGDERVLYDAQSAGPAAARLTPLEAVSESSLDDYVLSANGRVLAAPGTSATHVWELPSGKRRADLADEGADRAAVAVSADGRRVASAVQTFDGVPLLLVRELAGGAPVALPKLDVAKGDTLVALAFAPDSRQLAALGYEGLYLVPLGGGDVRRIATKTNPTAAPKLLTIDPTGKRLAASSPPRLIDTTSGSVRELDAEQEDASAFAFSPDGRLLATGTVQGTVRFHDAASGKALVALRSAGESEGAVAFTPDGKVELLGDAAVARRSVTCARGNERLPFEACEKQSLTPGLLAKLLAAR